MKNLITVVLLLLLTACNTQKKYSDFDYSYSRSGGKMAIYENLWIKGNMATYSFQKEGEKINYKFKLSDQDLNEIHLALSQNNFRTIQEDYKKVYDNVATIIVVKKGDNSASKSNASFIMEKDKDRWNNVDAVFKQIIEENQNKTASK